MHDIRFIRENPEAFDRALKRRHLGPTESTQFSSDNLISLDERRRANIRASETAQARRNAASKEIGDAKQKDDEATASKLMAEVADLKERFRRWRQSKSKRTFEKN